MHPIESFTLADFHRKKDKKILLNKEGKTISVEVDGTLIEAQFELNDGRYLIWLTEDCPFDEMLHVYLIDRDGTVEDSVEAGAPGGMGPSGILSFLDVGENWVKFSFFGKDMVCSLELSPNPKIFRPLPECWRYKTIFKKHQIKVCEVQREGK